MKTKDFGTKKISVVRSKKRKTIALAVTVDASVIVRAPARTSQSFIENFIQSNLGWLRRTLARVRRLPKAQTHQYAEGEHFMYLGEHYPLQIVANTGEELFFKDGFVLDAAHKANAAAAFTSWYKHAAEIVLRERAAHYAQKHALAFGSIKINSAERRWGSCSPEGNLNFTWRLIMAPRFVVDYVVCHELAHTKHQDHSKLFWGQVAAMCPEYAKARKWLRDNGGLCRL